MSRISKATTDKRQIINMLVGKGTGSQADSNSGDVAIPDGAFPAFLHTSCVVQYELKPMDGDAANRSGEDIGSHRSPSPMYASPTRAPSKVITPGMIEDGEDDAYDKEVDENEKERQKSEQQKYENKTNGTTSEEDHWDEKKEKKVILYNQTLRNVATEIWTAEQDGSISVREAATGRHVKGQPRVRRITVGMGGVSAHIVGKGANKMTNLHAKKDNSGSCNFVTCMIQIRDVVFAGYQDGYLRAFNVYTKEMTFQKKKHAGCINALSTWNNGNILFSASDDFRICMWKAGKEEGPDMRLMARRASKESKDVKIKKCGDAAVTEKSARERSISKTTPILSAYEENLAALDQPAPLHNLTGHINRVLCMRVEGDFLFSGGDDGMVRCWDIHQRNEIINSKGGVKCYPLFAHDGGVKDLTICEDVLFTAGNGGVSLWDIECCTLLHTFGAELGGEFNKIAVNPTSLTLWACCATDGRVFLYDLFSFQPIGNPLDHFGAASVKAIQTVSSSLSSRLFLCNKDSAVTVVYAETSDTGMRPSYEPVTDQMRREFECLDNMRQQLLSNDKLLREQRALLWYIRHTDEYHKECCADAMHRTRAEVTKREFLERSLVFLMKTRFRERQRVLAEKMELSCEKSLILSMFLKWYFARRRSKDAFFREFVTHSLSRGTNRDLVASHLQNALTYLRNSQQEKRNQALATMMEGNCYRKIQTVSFASWLRFLERAKRAKKINEMVIFMVNRTNLFTLRQRYNTLRRYLSMMRDARMKIHNTTMLVRTNGRILLGVYFNIMREFVKRKKHIAQRIKYIFVAEKNTKMSLYQRYFMGKWLPMIRLRKQIKVSESIKKFEAKTKEMEATMSEFSQGMLENVDSQLDAVIAELETVQKEVDTLKDGLGFLVNREQALMVEASIEPYEEKRALAKKYQNILEEEPLSMKSNGSFNIRNSKEPRDPKKEERKKKGLPSEFETYDATMKSLKPFSFNCNTNFDLIISNNKHSCKTGLKPTPLSPRVTSNFSIAVEQARCQFETKFNDKEILSEEHNGMEFTGGEDDPFAKFEEHDSKSTFEDSFQVISNEWSVNMNKIAKAERMELTNVLSPLREALIIWDYVSHRLSQHPDTDISQFVSGCTQIIKNLVPIRTAFVRENLLTVLQASTVREKKRSPTIIKKTKKTSASPKRKSSPKKGLKAASTKISTKKPASSTPTKKVARAKSPGKKTVVKTVKK
eukprot:Tbor_TRINITY_DN3453_c0_g2::TRINITY_DN3453_c0_g2_i1::g.3675::m.3675